jgi:thioredoxin reductase
MLDSETAAPTRVGLCVVGCGPTGIAALFEARARGVDAVGIEAGDSALDAIVQHLDGLVYASPADHFEVCGIPLDCAEPGQCTREDVLSYYARLINWGALRIWRSARCVDIHGCDAHVVVTIASNGVTREIIADETLVTSWYKRRAMRATSDASPPAPRVVTAVRNPIEYAGMRVAVVGGGLSGCEYAAALMRAGAGVSLVLNGGRREIHNARWFESLRAGTGSVIVEHAQDPRTCSAGLRYDREGRSHDIPCDVVVYARGAELDEELLAMLQRAGVFDEALVESLRSALTIEDALRLNPGESIESALRWVPDHRPDMWEHLFEAPQGIRLAGGILHVGGPHAGVVASIATARLAVRAALGDSPPAWPRPLATALVDIARLREDARSAMDWDLFAAIRPARRDSWSRGFFDLKANQPEDTARNTICTKSLSDDERTVLGLATGEHSVFEILHSPAGRALGAPKVLAALRSLWSHHALTWLPPAVSGSEEVDVVHAAGALHAHARDMAATC